MKRKILGKGSLTMNETALLAEELQGENLADRRRAAKMLALLAEESQPAAVALVHAVNDPDETVRNWVTEALENLGPPRVSDAQTLVNLAVESADADAQYHALVLIGRLAHHGADCFVPLLELDERASERTLVVRSQLLKTLVKIVPAMRKAELIARLEQHTRGSEPELQRLARRMLAQLDAM